MEKESVKTLKDRYCNTLNAYSRWLTREVNVGDVPLGGNNPIRVQSMTTTPTMDTLATVEQSIRMIKAGCEYVRITAPSIKEAYNLAEIKKELHKRGYHVPLIADIHFTPNAAEVAARIVEKVRINPGNYADKKRFDQINYTENEYQAELERIYQKLKPLIAICKEYGTAMRIGTNHGSLSDRIMSRHGDTPRGMVESAMEFMRMCHDLQYDNLVISMKASNPQVMVQAYRLLVEAMTLEGMNYPLHLGVTEAGEGEDGRIKSALGIGSLLEDGLGDTIRVSLTEEPEAEIPIAASLVARYNARQASICKIEEPPQLQSLKYDPYVYQKRLTHEVNAFIGGSMVPRVFIDLSRENLRDPQIFSHVGYLYAPALDKYHMDEQSVDFVYLADQLPSFQPPGNLKLVYNYQTWKNLKLKNNSHPLFLLEEYLHAEHRCDALNFIKVQTTDVLTPAFAEASTHENAVFIVETSANHGMADQRNFFFHLLSMNCKSPVIIKRNYIFKDQHSISMTERLQLYAATDLGSLLIDGFGDGIWIEALQIPAKLITSISFSILQAARSRISKTEYISCPSCGRTLFDLQETTQMVRSRTAHLKGLKIAIMGCIVNGPGEMADADYGYVGAGPGKVTLYRGKNVVKKNVDTAHALNEMISIIQEDGNWQEPLTKDSACER